MSTIIGASILLLACVYFIGNIFMTVHVKYQVKQKEWREHLLFVCVIALAGRSERVIEKCNDDVMSFWATKWMIMVL